MTLNGGKYTCSAHRERGTCSIGKIIAAEKVERPVLEGVREKLLAPEAIAEALRRHREAAAAERRDTLASRAPTVRDLAEIERKVRRAQEMCLNDAISINELKALTDKHAARKAELERKLASLDLPTEVAVHPGAAEAYARLAARLHEVMEASEGEKVREELRALIERVDFQPLEALGKFDLQVHGKLAALLGVSERAAKSHDCGVSLGAGTGFEPVTFRL